MLHDKDHEVNAQKERETERDTFERASHVKPNNDTSITAIIYTNKKLTI